MEPEEQTRKAPADLKFWLRAMVEQEGRTREAPACQEPRWTARAEPAGSLDGVGRAASLGGEGNLGGVGSARSLGSSHT